MHLEMLQAHGTSRELHHVRHVSRRIAGYRKAFEGLREYEDCLLEGDMKVVVVGRLLAEKVKRLLGMGNAQLIEIDGE